MLTIVRPESSDKFPLFLGSPIQDSISAHLDSGFGCEVFLNGLKLDDPATAKELQRNASVTDDVQVFIRPAGGILNPFNAANAFFWSIGDFTSAYLVRKAESLLTPQLPTLGTTSTSPNNSLTGQTNRARAYEARPDIYGQVRSYPDLIQFSEYKYIDNVKYVVETMDISRGRVTIEQVKNADTLLESIDGSTFEAFYPVAGADGYYESGTTTIPNVSDPYPTNNIDGQTLAGMTAGEAMTDPDADVTAPDGIGDIVIDVPVDEKYINLINAAKYSGNVHLFFNYSSTTGDGGNVDSTVAAKSYYETGGRYYFVYSRPNELNAEYNITTGVVTFTAPSYTAVGPYLLPTLANNIRLNYIFLRGLNGTAIARCDFWQIDESGSKIAGTDGFRVDSFSGTTTDQQFRTVDFTVPQGRYAVQFTRLNADVENDGTQIKIEEAFALRKYATKTFPGDTIIRVTTKATDAATGSSERKLNAIVTRWCRGMTTATQSATRSFARALVNEYVVMAGGSIDEIDIDALEEIEASVTAELLRFDYTFDDKNVSLGERLDLICNAARVFRFRDGQQWSFRRDQAQESGPVMQFDYRNISKSGESAISNSFYMPDGYDGISLQYVNPSTNKAAYIRLKINADGSISVGEASRANAITLAGCRTYSQALNRAYLECAKLVYQRESVTETVLADAMELNKGDLVRWIDPNDFYADDGLFSGEVLGISGGTITTSEPVDFGAETAGRVLLTNSSGGYVGPITCGPRTDGGKGFVVSVVPEGVYIADNARQCGSRYCLGPGLSDSDINAASLYNVADQPKKLSSGEVQLSLANYDARIYQYD